MVRNNKKMKLLYVSFSIMLLYCVSIVTTLSALERPDPQEIQKLRETKELSTRLEFVKTLGNHKIDNFLLQKALNRAERKLLEFKGVKKEEIDIKAPMMAPPPAWQGMPTKGNVKILAILIEFQDETQTNTRNYIHSNLFGNGDPARSPYESLATYYNRSSYNQLNLGSGNTLGWYQTSYNRTAVNQTRAGRENLIKEVLNHFDSLGHDFSQYDNDGDGVIDYFIVIWAGPDNGWANFWWGYQTSFSDPAYRLDSVRLGKYSWQWEARPAGGTFTPLVVIHETGHALGLPDYYDYDDAVGPRGGLGGLDMMDANRGDHNCFSKWVLDWLAPVYIFSGTQILYLEPSGTSQNCVLIWPPTAPNVFSEYFMVQNRQRVGNDDAPRMPGDGMLIWHVDASLNTAGTNYLYDNSFTEHKLLRLMEADGKEEIKNGGVADADDYYKAGNEFSPCKTPSSKKYDGTTTGIKVSEFSAPGISMSAQFEHGAKCPIKSWFSVYNRLAMGPSELMLVRKFRDTVLPSAENGKLYIRMLYENSDEALQVLLENPELVQAMSNLMKANMGAVEQAVQGNDAVISDTEETINFLDAFARKAPESLRKLIYMVKADLIEKQRKGEQFFGFQVVSTSESYFKE